MIGRVLYPYLYLSFTGLLFSCVSKNDVQPDDYLNKARDYMQTQQFQRAKIYVDSIRIRFPKDYEKIREGLMVMREIHFAEQKRTLIFCDSMLKVRQNELPNAQKDFIFEKDAEYESIGHYVYKTQTRNNSLGRTFLQTKVDENGNLILTSYYTGTERINHSALRARIKDKLYVESLVVPKDGALNYEFDDGGTHYEIVRFNRKAENGIVDFVLSHNNESVNITLIGNKEKSYILSADDKAAMQEAAKLSVILNDINRLLNEIRMSQAKMEYIRRKQQSAEVLPASKE